ncbi:MAG: hypothetical protein KTU85_04145 [Acidimicrobiia bacterium]|nr:hypothetical protein [Acidimicrobiia bacterium]MCY4458157.1 hypothetical protein [Acidimicrobiaceae bacterium]
MNMLSRRENTLKRLAAELNDQLKIVMAARSTDVVLQTEGFESTARLSVSLASATRKAELDLDEIDRFQSDARTQMTHLRDEISMEWQALVERRVPAQEGLKDLVETFHSIGGANDLVSELARIENNIRKLNRSGPSIEALEQLDQYASRLPEVLEQLVGEDQAVRSFASLVARGGAPIDGLTPTVREWLQAKGFETSFKIVAGHPVGD